MIRRFFWKIFAIIFIAYSMKYFLSHNYLNMEMTNRFSAEVKKRIKTTDLPIEEKAMEYTTSFTEIVVEELSEILEIVPKEEAKEEIDKEEQ